MGRLPVAALALALALGLGWGNAVLAQVDQTTSTTSSSLPFRTSPSSTTTSSTLPFRTTPAQEPTPYGPRVLGEQLGPPGAAGGVGNLPERDGPTPLIVAWTQGLLDSWYQMPLWSQAALTSAAIATLAIAVVALFRQLADYFLDTRRRP